MCLGTCGIHLSGVTKRMIMAHLPILWLFLFLDLIFIICDLKSM